MTFRPEILASELEGDHFKKHFPLFCTSFGPASDVIGSEYDLRSVWQKKTAAGEMMPDLTLVCGTKEFIRGRVEGDVSAMKELGVPVNYISAEGYDHDFRLWDLYLRKSLDELLPLKRRAIYPDEKND